jgi:hypothetical protein
MEMLEESDAMTASSTQVPRQKARRHKGIAAIEAASVPVGIIWSKVNVIVPTIAVRVQPSVDFSVVARCHDLPYWSG